MPNAKGRSLANRLAAVANKHSKAAVAQRSRNNLAAKLAAFRPVEPVYQNMKQNTKYNTHKNNKKNCGPKPSKIWKNKTSKTTEYLAWNACTKAAAAAGGARRMTRRH